MATEAEIICILDNLDAFMAKDACRHPAWRVRCPVCTNPLRRDLTQAILEGKKTQADVARLLGVHNVSVRNHVVGCLPKRGGAEFADAERIAEHRRRVFPVHASIIAQKKWLIQELLFARDEVLKKSNAGKIDTRQLTRLAKDISKLSDELANVRVASRERRNNNDGDEDEFSDHQLKEMRQVKVLEVTSGERSESNGPNGKA